MKLCPSCDRHLFGPASICPFCGAEQATAGASLAAPAMASVGLTLVLSAAACGPLVESVPSGEGDSGGTSTSTVTAGPVSVTTSESDGSIGSTTLGSPTRGTDAEDDGPAAFYAGFPPFDIFDGTNECDLYAQDCRDDEKCMPWADDGGREWNASRCSPLDPLPSAPGEPCRVEGTAVSGIDNCARGSLCMGVDPETNQGTCVALCENGADDSTCTESQLCSFVDDVPVVSVCLETCHPLMSGCAEGQGCYPSLELFVCMWVFDFGEHGFACDRTNDCTPGNACITGDVVAGCATDACCASYCDTTQIGSCPGADTGETCLPWFGDDPPPGLETVGVCGLE